ncbi:MAG: phenylalanine--tRNA ligase subunit alpha [Gammaproteobacteria bacterium]|nr:phenylalanine--tRNA ligase subunit alpha [Gammaproteobacteria bacterium]
MKSSLDNADQILKEAANAVNTAPDIHAIDIIKSTYLGKKGKLTDILRKLGGLSEEERPKVGQEINLIKEKIVNIINERSQILKLAEIEANLQQESIDVTLPSRGQAFGSNHPITKVQRMLEDFFIKMGFTVVEGPEVETEFYNFTALNIPEHHPARTAHDTFYFHDDTILRTQTSSLQIRSMEKMKPPLRIICPGKAFRRDNDATHAPMFHQLEMLMVDESVNFANLKWLISKFIESFFKEKIEYRFRPSYFPFTEPSAEVDVKWKVGDSWRWLELGGCGVVHPHVLETVGIDPKRFRGLAFGFGIDRLAMIYYGIDDIRLLFENDLEFLEQF